MSDAPLQPSTIAVLLGATAVIVTEELRGLGLDAGWRPAPGEWSASECVGHLIEADQRGFGGRIRTILAAAPGAPPRLAAWDPPGVAEARRDQLRPVEQLIDEFVSLREEGIALVLRLTPDDMSRSGSHPEVGELRVDELLGEWVHHDRNHVRQMLAVTQARIWAQMGNAREFSLREID